MWEQSVRQCRIALSESVYEGATYEICVRFALLGVPSNPAQAACSSFGRMLLAGFRFQCHAASRMTVDGLISC